MQILVSFRIYGNGPFRINLGLWFQATKKLIKLQYMGHWVSLVSKTIPVHEFGIQVSSMSGPGFFWFLAEHISITINVISIQNYDFEIQSPIVFLNDLWLFDPDTRMWTWIAGSLDYDQKSRYSNSIKGSSRIGSRHSHTMLLANSSSSISVFGGHGWAEIDFGNKTRLL